MVKIYGSLVLPVVLYGCASWCLTLREENIGGWRKLNNEELQDLCCSSNIIRVFRLMRKRRVGHVGCMREGDLHAGFWCRKRPHSRWEDNTEMELIGQGCNGMN
jgi:hypothetical protein